MPLCRYFITYSLLRYEDAGIAKVTSRCSARGDVLIIFDVPAIPSRAYCSTVSTAAARPPQFRRDVSCVLQVGDRREDALTAFPALRRASLPVVPGNLHHRTASDQVQQSSDRFVAVRLHSRQRRKPRKTSASGPARQREYRPSRQARSLCSLLSAAGCPPSLQLHHWSEHHSRRSPSHSGAALLDYRHL